MQFGVQLYTLRTVADSIETRIERVGETAFEGVEFAGVDAESPAVIRDALDRQGLEPVAAHVSFEALEADLETTLETYRGIGCPELVVPSYDSSAFQSAEKAKAAGHRLAELRDRCLEAGIELSYHNHSFEFTALEEETAFDRFLGAADGVGLELDCGLTLRGGVDPGSILDRYADRIRLLHLTDSTPHSEDPPHLDLGDGEVDLEGCLAIAEEAGVEWGLFEHGVSDDPLGSMEQAESVLQELTR